jgi:hypothetical protein
LRFAGKQIFDGWRFIWIMLYQLFEQVGIGLQKLLLLMDLALQLARLHGAVQRGYKGDPVERFLDKVVRASFHRFDQQSRIRVAGDK